MDQYLVTVYSEDGFISALLCKLESLQAFALLFFVYLGHKIRIFDNSYLEDAWLRFPKAKIK